MATSTLPENFLTQATLFLDALVAWERNLSPLNWQDMTGEVQAGQVAVFGVDMLNGFCYEGALSSPRVKSIIPAVVDVFQDAHALGVRDFILTQDHHTTDAAEFAYFPPHCQAGTNEAETVPELANLPFADLYQVVSKNSLNAFHGTSLGEWLEAQKNLQIAIVVGDCTDLCIYQLAMHIKLHAMANNNSRLRVIVPENAVQTYDTPVPVAKELGILPHDGDVMHLISLYQMALGGIEVVRELKPMDLVGYSAFDNTNLATENA
jgi:nicotinamidase-related amidase